MRIHVMAQDIHTGGHYCDNCPIYRAFARAGIHAIKVHHYGLHFGLDGMAFSSPEYTWEELGLKAIGEWVRAYDDAEFDRGCNDLPRVSREAFSFTVALENFAVPKGML